MKRFRLSLMAALVSLVPSVAVADPRLREVAYDPDAVVTVPVRRGVVTLVVFGEDESIVEVASGLGADCARAEAAWCVATRPGGRTLFVKPKSGARAANNLAVVTDRRVHNLRFVVLADTDPGAGVYRLAIRSPAVRKPADAPAPESMPLPDLPPLPAVPTPAQRVAERLRARPAVLNTRYTLAQGRESQDIVPSLVYDDGRFTYLRFPGNREVPAIFQVLGDGSEALVNTRMEDDILVVDRVSRRLMLRAGSAVVALQNEAFDPVGAPPRDGTTVPGVRRVLRPERATVVHAGTGVTP